MHPAKDALCSTKVVYLLFHYRVRFANTVFHVDSAVDLEWGYALSSFQTEEEPHVKVFLRYAAPGEDVGYRKVVKMEDGYYIYIPQGLYTQLSARHVLTMLPIEEILMEQGTLVLHSSFVLCQNQAILFSGPSGIGKSTQGDLWAAYADGTVINGDRALVTPLDDGVQVDSHFLSGTSGICTNAQARLNAIVLLEQGPENVISQIRPLDRFKKLLCQVSYYPDNNYQRIRVTELLEKLLCKANVCQFTCRKDESAVRCLKEYLFEQ